MSNVRPFAKKIKLPQLTDNQRAHLAWLNANYPDIYAAAMKKTGAQLNEVGTVDWGGIFTSVVETVKEAAPALMKAKAEYSTLKENLKRMKANQPPVDAGAYLPTYGQESYYGYQPQVAAKNLMPYVLIGGGLLVLFLFLRK